MITELAQKNRSYRRFDASVKISEKELTEFIQAACFCASGVNKQPLRYFLSCDEKTNDLIFPHLRWAGLLKEWGGPQKSERPSAYIVILADTNIWTALSVNDTGIAAQTILLAAAEQNLGGCMISNFSPEKLKVDLKLDEHLNPLLVLALGKPAEQVVLEPVREGKTAYYRNADDTHCVPKLQAADVIVKRQ